MILLTVGVTVELKVERDLIRPFWNSYALTRLVIQRAFLGRTQQVTVTHNVGVTADLKAERNLIRPFWNIYALTRLVIQRAFLGRTQVTITHNVGVTADLFVIHRVLTGGVHQMVIPPTVVVTGNMTATVAAIQFVIRHARTVTARVPIYVIAPIRIQVIDADKMSMSVKAI
ncbi:uncharacterized protein LOC117104527 [Anneissia japonica]|uniref:uncharacterized protein LOC117104527 n=1 Tax=Anneissia japonica TaxID=1529436 RepID=UPI0014256A8C|nr:uncharacterized protein LOC117104527 [Anneissia japonica]